MSLDTFTPIPLLNKETIHYDDRGHFAEVWHREKAYIPHSVFQVNHSHSNGNVLRGLHWQAPPYGIGKYVTCLYGSIQDVVVDIRINSKTFGKWASYTLSGGHGVETKSTRESLWVPAGFAHGFYVLSLTADVVYLQDGVYNPKYEKSLRYDDPDVGVEWQGPHFIVSPKDAAAPRLKDIPETHLFKSM